MGVAAKELGFRCFKLEGTERKAAFWCWKGDVREFAGER